MGRSYAKSFEARMEFKSFMAAASLVLTEAAVIERMAKNPQVTLHTHLFNAPLIYSSVGRSAFYTLYRDDITIALSAGLPMLLQTPTWRAGRDQIQSSRLKSTLNSDAVRFMRELIRDLVPEQHPVFLGGLMGSQKDCYRPDLAPDENTAERYHTWQAAKLSEAGVDFLLAATLPSVMEAKGLARALQRNQTPYLISFVINPQGRVLDGTKLADAMEIIDCATDRHPPLGYMVNCAYPSFLDMAALPRGVRGRLWGYQANASSKPAKELDGSSTRQMDDINDWAKRMAVLHRQWGLKILGGCCGTDHEHLRHLICEIRGSASVP